VKKGPVFAGPFFFVYDERVEEIAAFQGLISPTLLLGAI
jgi:hypothetical protein